MTDNSNLQYKADFWCGFSATEEPEVELFMGARTENKINVDIKAAFSEEAQHLGAFVRHAINSYAYRNRLIEGMAFVLRGCLELNGKMDWGTEQDITIMLEKVEEMERFEGGVSREGRSVS